MKVVLSADDYAELEKAQGDAETFGIGFLKLTPSGFERLDPDTVIVRLADSADEQP